MREKFVDLLINILKLKQSFDLTDSSCRLLSILQKKSQEPTGSDPKSTVAKEGHCLGRPHLEETKKNNTKENNIMERKTEANLAPIEPKVESQLMIDRPPELTLAEASKAAQALKKVIDTKGSKVVLGGKTYLQF